MIQTLAARPRTVTRTLPRVPALNGLRGLAVLGVVLYHSYGMTGGWIGVDVFFVLSGFLITALLVGEHARSGRISLLAFYGRRARRLVPALALFVAVYVMLDPQRMHMALGAYANNFREASHHNTTPGIGQTWSLAAEEQFYVVWPLLLAGLLRLGASRRACVAFTGTVIAALSIEGLVLALRGTTERRLYYGPDTHATPILLGCLLALAWTAGWLRQPSWRVGSAAGAVLFALALTLPRTAALWFGPNLAVAGATGVLVLYLVDRPNHAALTTRPLLYLGAISYALYLWHPLTDWVANGYDMSGLPPTPLRATVAVVVAVLLAAASHRFVERRFTHRQSTALRVPAALADETFVAQTAPMRSEEAVIIEKERGRARIVLNRPERHNAIGGGMSG